MELKNYVPDTTILFEYLAVDPIPPEDPEIPIILELLIKPIPCCNLKNCKK